MIRFDIEEELEMKKMKKTKGKKKERLGWGFSAPLFITNHISHNMLIISLTVYKGRS
jgi:hypothetical protein